MIKFNSTISTFNLVLVLIGYQLLTVLLGERIGENGDSQKITIPFRSFCLFVSLIVVFINRGTKQVIDKHIRILLVFWLLLLLRFSFDMFIIYPNVLSSSKQMQLWLYMVGLTLIPMYSVIKSFNAINIDVLFKWLFAVSSFITLFLYFTVDEFRIANADRLSLVGLNSISIGYCGLISIVLGLYNSIIRNTKLFLKILSIIIVVIGFLVLMRAGSRGPLLSLGILAVIFLATKSKHPMRNLSILCILIGAGYLLFDYIMSIIENISPVLYRRLTRDEGQLNDRLPLYLAAWDGFLINPLAGNSFAIYHNGTYSYAHNVILDSMMQLGMIGLCLIIYVYQYGIKMVLSFFQSNSELVWLGFLMFKSMMELMVSGSIYTNPEFSVLFVLSVLFYYNYNSKTNIQI